MKRSLCLAATGLFALMQAGAVGQENASGAASAQMTLRTAGSNSHYSVDDVVIYLATTEASADAIVGTELTLSLNTISPVDRDLLAWSAQPAAARELRDVTIHAELGGRQVTYVLDDAQVTSFSASNSIYNSGTVSLQVIAAGLVVDGVEMN